VTRHPALPLALTMLVTFSIAFCFLWRNHAADSVSAPAKAAAETPLPVRSPAQSPPVAQPAELALPAAHAGSTAPAPAAAAVPPVSAAAEEMPVELHFRHRPDLNSIQASLLNRSENALVVDALVFDPRTQQTSKVQLSVAAYKAATFGVDDGLDIQSGDQITLRCAPYQDKVFPIR
jgi:hypothetical protein